MMENRWRGWLDIFAAVIFLVGGLASIFGRDHATMAGRQSSAYCSVVCPCGVV
jgi:hypothetical protein